MTQRKSGLVTPGPLIRPRIAPGPRIGAGVGGWLEWQLIDRRGRAVKGGQQHNLYLDQGLDHLALTTFGVHLTHYFARLSVGTSSVEPDPTDTALGAELATTTTRIGSPDWTRVSDGVYEITVTFEFDYGDANGVLTEWGVRAFDSPNPLLTRELFRDGGTPVSITKTSDYKLRGAYTFRLELTPTVLTPASFTISGIGLISGNYTFRGGAGDPSSSYSLRDLYAFGGLAADLQSTTYGLLNANSGVDSGVYADVAGVGMSRTGSSQSQRPTTQTASAYVAGSFTRSASGLWGTDKANGEIATLAVQGQNGTTTQARTGFVFIIDEADRFTKDNEHTLTINDLCTVTWGRG